MSRQQNDHSPLHQRSPVTTGVKAGIESDTQHGAITPPLYLSSNYSFAGFDNPRQYDYTRSGNPTRDVLGQALAELEEGAVGVITSTGMSSILLVLQLLQTGDRLIAPHDCYGGTHRLFTHLAARGLFDVEFVDQRDPQALAAALNQPTRLVWIETPSNPLLRVTDIKAVSAQAH